MNQPSKFEWALGLYDYLSAAPNPQTFARFFRIVSDFLGGLSIVPSHIAAEGEGYTGKLTKSGSAVTKRLVESEFAHISALSIVVSPNNSKEPAFDRLVSASLTWTALSELQMCLVANEASAQFLGSQFDSVLKTLLEWRTWAFGFGLKDEISLQPELHILTIDNGRLTNQEREALTRWYRARNEDRQVRLRDVYPVNVLNQKQTDRVIAGRTFGAIIESIPDSKVEEINGVTLWKVPESKLAWISTDQSSPKLWAI